ncbi:MAG TPA: acyl-CoA dehydrogenase family protein [Ktedonobacterales bacterium]|jgi:alkylation response protein AidB-like acyl-CoA dehydrogenase
MIDFAPTEEQAAIRDLARQIAMEQFRKLARPADEACITPDSLLELLGQTGLLSPFPETSGGAGVQSAVTHALLAEELAHGDGGLGLSYIGALLPGLAVLIAGTEAQQQALLPRCSDGGVAGSLGWSEPTSGLDARETQTTLDASSGALAVAGSKRGVVHGVAGGLRVVTAREGGAAGLDGLRLVVLLDEAAGVTVAPEAAPLGLRAAPRARLRLEHVAVSASDVLGGPDAGAAGAQRFIALANVLLGALAVGIARAALDYAADYAKGRVQFGKPISSFQAIAFMAAEMAMETDAARLLLWRAAYAWDGEDAGALRRAERARMQAVKVAQRVTTDAVQILGGAGFLQDHPVELWMRDAEALAALG